MKIPYKEAAKKRIVNFQEEIDKSIKQLGVLDFINILEEYFGLLPDESHMFINLFEKLDYIEAGYDVVPEGWYFKQVGTIYKEGKDGKRRKCEKVGHLSSQIYKEREEIRLTIKRFRKLSDNLKEIALKKWSEKYRPYVMNDKPDYEENIKKYFPSNVANKILADRWGVSQEAIRKNIKKETRKKTGR